ncbi:Type I restriction modification DNA specificity domain [Bacteroides ovatus]|uniref:Type I restriction modification DNA specificity domain protein n=1 Tax=Bacteroides ovatus (strain ATCC 8483 / DSM 1896 / JCM 5824 / BCRC 10623 / CCUG 4943 / NCTC 11153) TaxID=411476 RepID=A0AAN3A4M1_BACO1|nr:MULTISPECIES: restriction endonuclease subunit S [Bacteroides]ALJ46170.1 EcoKI restriction-modification system protein HsdS [Bacteroides ovatus]EDO09791.1 type I restriction modification DNA specificity domain protein [Bacteroides ovatus ATCC 8483]PQL41137.1 restriction endonuclease subunit S [Bacteroides ovatus]QRQ57753.1 restriction endonuclease subunit S [Bacteroides ovatus]UBN56652.1 restriction endonuclease subunit S [Bacteroides ovatus]
MSQFIEMFKEKGYPLRMLKSFADVSTGGTPSKANLEYWNGDKPWVSAEDMKNKYVYDTCEKVTEAGYATCKIIPVDTLMYVCRGSIGVMAINKIECATNQSICRAKCHDNVCNVEFLYHALMYQKDNIKKMGTGTSFKSLNQTSFSELKIELPPYNEQMKFVSIAQQADKSKFGDFKSQFIEMFGNPLSLNQKNELKRLGECCILNPRRPNIALCDTDKVSFIPMPAVSEDGYLVDMTDEEYGKVKKGFTYFENNDVLFAKITPCMENGKGAIVHGLTNGIGMGSTEFHVLRPINGISSPYWLLALTRMPIFRERAAKNMSGTGGQKRVSASYLDHFMVGLPAMEEQRRFEAIYRQADKSKSVIQKALVYLNDIQSDELGKIA